MPPLAEAFLIRHNIIKPLHLALVYMPLSFCLRKMCVFIPLGEA